MFDQRGAESRQDGSGDQGFATKRREERVNETFVKSPAFKVSLLVRVRTEARLNVFSLQSKALQGVCFGEKCEKKP